MRFEIGLVKKFALALAVVVSAGDVLAASVAPLYFEGVDEGAQQDYWENLMKYKLWGTHKLDFNNGIISISDDVGYNGTADGDFTVSNGDHHIGGPTLIGGNVKFINSNNDTLSVGPTRILGDLQVSTAMNSDFQGNFCVQGAVSGQYGDANVRNWEGLVRGNGADIYAGDQYANCPSSVPEVDVSLKVPVWPTAGVKWEQPFEMTSCYENETKFIHVPPDSVEMNAYGTYDKYIKKFTVGCSAKKKLYVLMPPGGKLTRIFSEDGFEFNNAANDLIIQVVYVAPGTNFNKATKEWDLTNKGEFSYIGNKEYVGNLLFYTNKDIQWDYWVDASFQGSWITTGDLTVGGHFKCAGQLIGNNLLVMNNVVGDFKYVPFDPPWIDVGDPTARSWGVVKESERGPQSLKVELSKEPTTNVTFKYCFDFKGNQSYNRDTDPDSAHALASLDDVVASSVPVCNGAESTVYKTTTFLRGQVIPTQKITVEVADDHDVEWTERFTIRIFDLEGAVLQHIDEKGQITQVRSGEFYIEIEDDDDLFISKDTSVVVVEDIPYPFLKTDFPIMTPDSVVWEGDFAIRFGGTTSDAGTLSIGGNAVKQGSEISSKDIAEGKLVYTPAENVYSENGTPIDSITYYIVRSGNQSVEAYKMYFVVTPVNDAPAVEPVTFTIKENVVLGDPNGDDHASGSLSAVVDDVDDEEFTYKFDDEFDSENTKENYDKVTSLYTLDPETGKIVVKEGAKLNYESADSLLTIRVVVTDKSASTGNPEDVETGKTIITIRMLDVNEKPEIEPQTFSIDENPKKDANVDTVVASDPDRATVPFGQLVFTIPVNEDADKSNDVPFRITPEGVIFVTDSSVMDFEKNPVFEIEVQVADKGEPALTEKAKITIKLKDVNEPPKFIDDGEDYYDAKEHSKEGTEIARLSFVDYDAKDVKATDFVPTLIQNKTTAVGNVSANDLFALSIEKDAEGDTLFYVVISVKDSAKLNYEDLAAAEKALVSYDVTISIKDHEGAADANEITIDRKLNVVDVNEAPSAENADFTPDEDIKAGDLIGVVVATDPDTKNVDYRTLIYTIVENEDASDVNDVPFTVNNKGEIRVAENATIDFESKVFYEFDVKVTDGLSEPVFAHVTVTLQDVNEDPEIVCLDGDDNCEGPFNIAENSATDSVIHSFGVVDFDKDSQFAVEKVILTDVNNAGAEELFDVVFNSDKTQFDIIVKEKSKLDYESINASYTVSVKVSDAAGASDTIIRVINVIDVNEPPTAEDFTKEIEENLPNGSVVGTVVAKDPDVKNPTFSKLTYSIPVNEDADKSNDVPFAIDPATGEITVTNSSKLDFEKNSSFEFKVEVKDIEYTATSSIKITLSDEEEPPEIIPHDPDCAEDDENCNKCDINVQDCGEPDVPPSDDCTENCGYVKGDTLYVKVRENTISGTKILEYYVKDEDVGDLESMKVTFEDVYKTGADSLFAITSKLVLDAKGYKLMLSVKDSSKLDFETVKASHTLRIIVNDDGGKSDSIVRVIQVVDVNEPPTAEDLTKEIEENLPNGSVVGTVVAKDPDVKNPTFSKLTYSIPVNEDADKSNDVPFAIDPATGEITVTNSSKLDFEKNSSFEFKVEVKDIEYTATSSIKITLSDEEEPPEIIPHDPDCAEDDENCNKCDINVQDCGEPDVPPSDDCTENCGYVKGDTLYVKVRENTISGTKILEYYVKDDDKDDLDNMVVSFRDVKKTGADSLFTITPSLVKDEHGYKFVVTVDTDNLDYETTNHIHPIMITVKDDGGLSDDVLTVIQIVDENELPFIENAEFSFDEHNEANTVIGTIEWGDDKDLEGISNPEFRENHVVAVGGATDIFDVSPEGVITVKKTLNYETDDTSYTLIVSAQDKNEPTLASTETITIHLKNVLETPVITSTEFDIDENPKKNDVIGTITSEDKDDLENKETRTYELVTPSDFVTVTKDGQIKVKNPSKFDYETTPEIEIKVKVTDPQKVSSDTTITIRINDVNEAPTLDDKVIKVSEDTKPNTVIDTVKAVDPDKDPKYTDLTYTIVEGDTSMFEIDSKTGVITLKDSLDYERAKEYDLKIEVFDGEFADTAKITVSVQNVVERSEVIIEKVEDGDSTWFRPDSVFTNRPNVTICWTEDDKGFCSDTTLTEGIHTIIKTFKDSKKDFAGTDTVVIHVSTAAPEVIVSANGDDPGFGNIFTIDEGVAEGDSSIYVNDTKNDIYVTIKDPVKKKDSTFVVNLDLETVDVSKKDLESIASVVEKGNLTLNESASEGVIRTPVNGTEVKVSYTEKVGDKNVKVTYFTDKNGEVLKTPVVDEKGNVDSIEVITVSYTTKIGGKEVVVSYQADAVTGQVLNVGADGALTYADQLVIPGTSSGSNSGSSSGNNSGSSTGSKPGSSDKDSSTVTVQNVGSYKVTYEYEDQNGNTVEVTYTIDEKGNIVKNGDGDIGYTVSYTYENKFGNSATQSVFIVLDQVPPKVEILYPTNMQVIRSNSVEVQWTVNGVLQDTLTLQGLEKGYQKIYRYYRDKAGNAAYDSVVVIMKDAKDMDLAVETPVVQMDPDVVEEYYAVNPPKKGETAAISIKNPTTGKEVEALTLGGYGQKDGTFDTPYPGVTEDKHLGPTVAMDIRLPVVNDLGGLATFDDLILKDGTISSMGVDSKGCHTLDYYKSNYGFDEEYLTVNDSCVKYEPEQFVERFCKDDVDLSEDLSRLNLYKTRMHAKVWIYTSLGNFVDYYSFKIDLNDPDYTNEAGVLQMYFEQKPDRNGEIRTEDGHVLATGAYLYKVEANIRAELRCTLPPFNDAGSKTVKKKGDVIKKSDEMLKSFGYKRPKQK